MSDTQATTTQPAKQPAAKGHGSVRQGIFNVIGWLAFLLLLPPLLEMLGAVLGQPGLGRLQQLITEKFGVWGSPFALVLYFYFLLFMRVFFGSDQRYTPVLLGYVVSFLLFSISLNIGFMSWLYELAQQVPFLSHNVYNFVTAIAVILLANALSASQKMKLAGDILLIIVLPLGVLVAAGIFLPGLLAKIGL
ncbi:MAG: hypothetical protein A2087_01650 [Spirochaetes bacterium GWD1_61_31]|nr:MAG: hypothetical protein A2Y37_10435 [Spirochaetes bacterium GWB1_60_80]OHD29741.1 MAG: hypothetical protein A2004_04710 [Spirochaetes bacterium GWC1_61_12]OHD35779.1 MAG: hypothetical protein A2087_01650 [Spirochaetes bacterium GWD1_61_31]OHD42916.1 MAG: hypothetical protein A2Y35_14085 [Spirochaetes bacterium GWE1_60_18]OHD61284.1 MAG: hypothetical protein A2Y32_04130 [Spirochaetes bacterium GWF1_60_12]HAP43784.1 hypothetical protein [Spirochaetaceae bacterium]